MIVQCEKCQSKFNLSPDLVKPTGTIVRCSICKNIFVVHPEIEKEEPQVLEEKKEESLDQLFEEIGYGEAPLKKEEVAEKEVTKEEVPAEEKLFKDLLGEEKEVAQEKGALEESTSILEEAPKEEVLVPKKKRSRLVILLIILGLLLIGGFIAAFIGLSGKVGIDLGKISSSKAGKQSPDDPGNKKLSLFDVSGKFVKNQKSGSLFVVSGTVKNRYPGNRSYILVKANLLDSKGNVIKSETAYAGNIFSESELEKLSIEEINSKMKNKDGDNNSNVNIEPNGTRKFMVVFSDLPQNLSEFTVQALESKPAEALKK